jgi:predicted cupin superfamily sugar epimerase
VVPGFEFADHDFLTEERFKELLSEEQVGELEWLVRRE